MRRQPVEEADEQEVLVQERLILRHLPGNGQAADAIIIALLAPVVLHTEAARTMPLEAPLLLVQRVTPAGLMATEECGEEVHVRQTLLAEVDGIDNMDVRLEVALHIFQPWLTQPQPLLPNRPHVSFKTSHMQRFRVVERRSETWERHALSHGLGELTQLQIDFVHLRPVDPLRVQAPRLLHTDHALLQLRLFELLEVRHARDDPLDTEEELGDRAR